MFRFCEKDEAGRSQPLTPAERAPTQARLTWRHWVAAPLRRLSRTPCARTKTAVSHQCRVTTATALQHTHDSDDPLPTRVDLEPSQADAVLAADVVDLGDLGHDLDEALLLVLGLEELLHLARAHRLAQRHRHGRDDALEPRRDVRHERDLELVPDRGALAEEGGEVEAGLALVDVVGEGVGLHGVVEVLGGHLGLRARLGPGARVARDGRDGRGRGDVRKEGREEELRVGREAAGVGDPLGLRERLARVQLCKQALEK